ncbi:MAG TPA: LacI family DNA-binding transcriptional regulator [Pyrinomonadaceae bacterium]|nr:LacI family DNA-binding transcriptional regulator [Pyrinomonadaceae bacterium]
MPTELKKKTATLSDIAEAAGVAAMTVSRVVSGVGYVSESTRERVLKALKDHNFRRNGLARGLKRRSTETVGLVLGDISNPYSTELARGVRETLLSRGFNLFICISDAGETEDTQAFKSLAEHSVDGIIVATRSNKGGDKYLRELVETNVPVVALGRDLEHRHVDLVGTDNFKGGFVATEHLIERGHKRIAFLGANLSVGSQLKRLQGYVAALEENAIAVDDELVVGHGDDNVGGYSTEEIGFEGMKRLLSLKNRPTAVFARNDFTAIGAMRAISDAGLSIPKDVAVVGFDDIPMAARMSPSLTTVRQPMRLQGEIAATMLLDRITSKTPIRRRQRVLDCELIVRESSSE